MAKKDTKTIQALTKKLIALIDAYDDKEARMILKKQYK